jgi:hypothetical protein
LYYTGKVVGESAMKTESDIGSAIKYIFRVRAGGNTTEERLKKHILENAYGGNLSLWLCYT